MKRDSARAALAVAAAALVAGLAAAALLPPYWIFLATSLLISAIALQSLGLVAGRTGMIALCQMSFAGVGAWTVGALNVAEAPGGLAVWIVVGGLAAVPFGVAIGLPALRLRGIHLAIVTLSFATAFDSVLSTITFPGQTRFLAVARPAAFDSDAGYFLFVLSFYVAIAAALEGIARTRQGSAWLAVRHSERAAAALGVSVPRAKLTAFALSAFIAGVSGGLLAGYLGTLVSDNFGMMQSLVLFTVATMVGAHFAEGAILGALLITMFPELLRRLGLPQDIGNVLFAVGATQALSTGETMSEALRRVLRRRVSRNARTPPEAVPATAPAGTGGDTGAGYRAIPLPRLPTPLRRRAEAALAVDGLSVRYGSVVALDAVSLDVPPNAVVGLIGPNGAGKSTFIDAVTGFLGPCPGSVRLEGSPLDRRSPHRRARMGVRRTWQTTRIAPELTVGAYLRLTAGALPEAQLRGVLDWLRCPDPRRPVSTVDAGTRRLLDVAAAVAALPAVLLLDEPAAGQSYDTALELGRRIAEIPRFFGCAVLLVEHDMDLVRAACSSVAVLDFGRVIACGSTDEVLGSESVRTAYLGVQEGERVA